MISRYTGWRFGYHIRSRNATHDDKGAVTNCGFGTALVSVQAYDHERRRQASITCVVMTGAFQNLGVEGWPARCSLSLTWYTGCPTWWNLTALHYHYATQCIPTPWAWIAHQMPNFIQKFSVACTFLIEVSELSMHYAWLALIRFLHLGWAGRVGNRLKARSDQIGFRSLNLYAS
jgi:hypothetical protein